MVVIKKYLKEALTIFTDIIFNPIFDEKEFDKSKERTVASLESIKDNPDSYLGHLTKSLFFKGHPYYNFPGGRLETVIKFTNQDIKNRHHSFLKGGQFLVVVVGRVDETDIKEYFQDKFGHLDNYKISINKKIPFKIAKRSTLSFEKRDIPTTLCLGYFSVPNPKHKDFPALITTMDILDKKLWERIRTKEAITYSVQAGNFFHRFNYGYLYFNSAKPYQAMNALFEVIEEMKQIKVTLGEIKRATNVYVTEYLEENESALEQAGLLAYFEIIEGGWKKIDEHLALFEQVSPDDIIRMANLYLKNFSFVALGANNDIAKSKFFK